MILCAVLALQGLGVHADPSSGEATQLGAAKLPAAERASFLQLTRLARSALYPAYDESTMLTGEAFRSRSLGHEAADMLLQDFNLARVPGSTRLVAAALLKPTGFPASYTLLEVAVLQHVPGAGMSPPGRPKGEYRSAQHEGGPVHLVNNLKVRVDPGTGSGELQMQLTRVSRRAPAVVGFDVVVTADGEALRHRFRQDESDLALVESVPAR